MYVRTRKGQVIARGCGNQNCTEYATGLLYDKKTRAPRRYQQSDKRCGCGKGAIYIEFFNGTQVDQACDNPLCASYDYRIVKHALKAQVKRAKRAVNTAVDAEIQADCDVIEAEQELDLARRVLETARKAHAEVEQ
jgi:hypothetical protein